MSFMSSATPGGILDRAIQAEESKHGDFLRLVKESLLRFFYVRSFLFSKFLCLF